MDKNETPVCRIRHADDEEWQEVLAQDHNGRRVSVWEKWLEFSPHVMSFVAKWDPGMMVRAHGHGGVNTIYVISGSMTVGGVPCKAGSHITLDVKVPYGPIIAGPEGVEVYEVIFGDTTSYPSDDEGFAKLLAEKGVKPLPNPPIKLPEWRKDSRKT